MSYFVAISGSPSAVSRSSILVNFLRKESFKQGFTVKEYSVLDFPADVLIEGRYDDPSIKKLSEEIKEASGILIISPVYKASYTGTLKALLDILPQDVFKDKPVFPLMVGGSPAHLLAIDYSLKPLLAALSAQTILKGVYLTDQYVDKEEFENPIKNEELLERITDQLGQLTDISQKTKALL
ncbi:FMN reductase (NADPH) [Bacillus sp. ZZV12-4809]|nr:FMN reductase (NADPH) [Bacillus sp. ZZV12-4809]